MKLDSADVYAFVRANLRHNKKVNAAIFNTMRILKRINLGDTYYENYLWHYEKRKETFVDVYHLMWAIGSCLNPEYILEIGSRTGISICQLMSAMMIKPKMVTLCDIFNDSFISPDVVKMNMKYLNLPVDVVSFEVGDSTKTLPMLLAKNQEVRYDYILVDGDHSREVAAIDLRNAVPMLASPGIILFDDIGDDGCSLMPVWEEFKKEYENKFYFVEDLNGKGVGVGVKHE